jgi:L-fuculose-phosphate aldolase
MVPGRRVAEHELRQEMVRIGRLMWERGYVAATDGNLSARLGNERLLVTATGHSKGTLSLDDLIILDLEGEPVPSYRGRGQHPSSEILMHLEVYRQRPDVAAIVHAHPPVATAFSIAGVSLARCVLPEVVISLGSIPTAEYATPGTTEMPLSIREAIKDHDALILAHHGSLTVGETLWEAYLRLEKVEHTAQITLVAHQLGQVRTLSPQAVEQLVQKRQQLLREQGRDVCADCDVCALDGTCALPPQGAGSDVSEEEALIRQISQAVLNNLEGGSGRR